MPSDFAKVGKTLEDALTVPDLSIDSIRSAARAESLQHQWRVFAACALAAIVALGSGSVLAARVFGFRMWVSGDEMANTRVRSFTEYLAPDGDTLRHAVSSATFPVVLPVGLPNDDHVLRLVVAPTEHPSVITIQYEGNGYTEYTLIDSSLVQNGKPPKIAGLASTQISESHYWRAGGEVVVSEDPSTWPQDSRVRAAMLRATPQGSLTETLPRLYHIASVRAFGLGVENTANALAPPTGRSALVGPENLKQVPALIRAHQAILVSQSTKFDHIPVVRGHEDLAHASHHPGPQRVAVSAGGVRAVGAVLTTGACGPEPKFTCEILINERSGMPYHVWVLPIRSPQASQTYVVDPRSFHVERAQ